MYWSNLFTPRQLLVAGKFSEAISQLDRAERLTMMLVLGRLADFNAKLCLWDKGAGNGAGSTHKVFLNQALNILYNYAGRSWFSLRDVVRPKRRAFELPSKTSVALCDARHIEEECDL